MIRSRSTLLFTALLAAGTLAVGTALAKDAGTTEQVEGTSTGRLITAPARQLASIAPGGHSSFPMIVQNRLGRTATIEVGTFDLAPGRDAYSELAEAGSEGRGAGTWLSPGAGTFVLKDGERRTFPVEITVPTTAGPGGHFGAVTVQVRPEQQDDDRIGVGVRIATNVTVLVPGDVRYDGTASHVHLARTTARGLRVSFDAKTTGNIQTKPSAKIVVEGPFGHTTKKTVELPEILPGGTRHIVERVERPAGVGTARASVRLTFEDQTRSKAARSNEIRLWPKRSWFVVAGAAILAVLVALEVVRRWRIRRLLERYGDDDEYVEDFASDDEPSGD